MSDDNIINAVYWQNRGDGTGHFNGRWSQSLACIYVANHETDQAMNVRATETVCHKSSFVIDRQLGEVTPERRGEDHTSTNDDLDINHSIQR